MLIQRLQKELQDIAKNPNKYFVVAPSSDLLHWKATILGPEDTPYHNHQYHLLIDIPKNYPFSSPTVRFAQPCYHPNISTTGQICMDILSNKKWSPIQNISSVLISIISFLADPNCSSPLNAGAARIYDYDISQFNNLVQRVYQKADQQVYKDFPVLT
jgi:ubiquitin-protein ligase